MVVKSTETIRFMVAFAISHMLPRKNPIWLSANFFFGLLLAKFIPPLVYINLAFARVFFFFFFIFLTLYVNYENELQTYETPQRETKRKKKLSRGAVAGATVLREEGYFDRASTVCSLFFLFLPLEMRWPFFSFPLSNSFRRILDLALIVNGRDRKSVV